MHSDRTPTITTATVLLAAVFAGCSAAPPSPPRPAARAAAPADQAQSTAARPAVDGAPAVTTTRPTVDHERPSAQGRQQPTLADVQARVLEHHNLEVAAEAIRVAEVRALEDQADLWPNPYLLVRERKIRDLDPIDTPMIEVELGQPFELGGKRAARARLARARTEVADAELLALVFRTLRTAESRYVAALRLQRELTLVREEADAAARLQELAAARLRAGKDSRVPLLRAAAAAADARRAVADRERALATACRELDEVLGLTAGTTDGVSGDLTSPALLAVDRAAARRALDRHPRLEAARSAISAAGAAVDAADANVWPDLTVGLAYEREQLTNEDFLGFYLRLPLPVWNRDQGLRASAQAAQRRAGTELAGESLALSIELQAALLRHDKAQGNVADYRDRILPQLAESHRLAEHSFRAGRGSRLEVLDAQLALVRARRALLDHVEQQALAAAELRYLAASMQ